MNWKKNPWFLSLLLLSNTPVIAQDPLMEPLPSDRRAKRIGNWSSP